MAYITMYEFTVEGKGEFAFDMLRRDRCWPKTETTDSVNIAPYHRSALYKELRQVTLVGLSPPTEGRWESFGWRVISTLRRKVEV